jgi:glycine hydroxymethyltransferase
MPFLKRDDPEIAELLRLEEIRQSDGINLIASENYAYESVQEAVGSVFANKYAEGYPGKRYYAGCEYVDQIEQLAIDRCKKLFKADHANVQPHSGSAANMTVYMAVLNPGDTIMGMSLASGGHLTHGHGVSFSGMLFKSVAYDVDPKTELIDYEDLERKAREHKPKLIIVGGSSYSRIIDFERVTKIARLIDALVLADCAHLVGLVAAGLYPNPFPHVDFVTATTHKTLRGPRGGFILCKEQWREAIDRAVFPLLQGGPFMNAIAAKAVCFKKAMEPDFTAYQKSAVELAQQMVASFKELGYRIVSDGTDTHLFVVDLRNKGITGRAAELALEKEKIYVSRSAVPFDPEKPYRASGIRIGMLSLTVRGFTRASSQKLGYEINTILMKV